MKKEVIKESDVVCDHCGYPFDVGDKAIYDDGCWFCSLGCAIDEKNNCLSYAM